MLKRSTEGQIINVVRCMGITGRKVQMWDREDGAEQCRKQGHKKEMKWK